MAKEEKESQADDDMRYAISIGELVDSEEMRASRAYQYGASIAQHVPMFLPSGREWKALAARHGFETHPHDRYFFYGVIDSWSDEPWSAR